MSSDSDFDDSGIIADIPGDSCLSSSGAMNLYEAPSGLAGATGAPAPDLNEQVAYRSNCVRDFDNVQKPKEESIERWETPDFHEFNRVFKLPRAEMIYLIKGIAYEKKFCLNL